MKVVILGAGIGGLSAAHYLNQYSKKTGKDIDIIVIERHETAGGQARSKKLYNKDHSEYCWHAIGTGYYYLISLLQEIPTEQDKTVLDHLKPIEKYIYGSNDYYHEDYKTPFATTDSILDFYRGIRNCNGTLTLKDMLMFLIIWFIANAFSDENLKDYDSIKWSELLSGLSQDAKTWAISSTSIFLGMDYANLSAQMMFDLLRTNIDNKILKEGYDFYSFDGPMNEVWIDPWVNYLRKEGVHFYFNTTIEKINTINNEISDVLVRRNDIQLKINGDWFVNSLPVEITAELLNSKRYKSLASMSKQIQTQVLYKFPNRLNMKDASIIIFPQTPWFLMARHEGVLWNLKDMDYLSVGVGIWDINGDLYGKPASEHTKYELARECWHQMNFYGRQIMEKIECNKTSLWRYSIPEWNIWDSFETVNGNLETYEPKFSNNINTLELRPKIVDDFYSNLGHATAYTNTETNIFCMESAVEAGNKLAYYIVYEKEPPKSGRKNPRNCFYKFLRWLQ